MPDVSVNAGGLIHTFSWIRIPNQEKLSLVRFYDNSHLRGKSLLFQIPTHLQ